MFRAPMGNAADAPFSRCLPVCGRRGEERAQQSLKEVCLSTARARAGLLSGVQGPPPPVARSQDPVLISSSSCRFEGAREHHPLRGS